MNRWWVISLVVAALAVLAFVERDRLAGYLPQGFASSTAAPGASDGQGGRRAMAGPTSVSVKVAAAKAGSLPILRRTIGTIVPLATTALSSPAAGIVATVAVKDGAIVKAGDVVVQLDDRAVRAAIEKDKAAIAKDQATLDDANASLQRVQDLLKTGIDTKQAGDDAIAAVKVAQAALAVDQAQLASDQVALAYTQILAPFDGQLGALLVSPGAFVAPGTPVATLTQMRPVYAEFTLPETDLQLARGARAAGQLTVETSTVPSIGDGPKTSGPIVFIDNQVDAASATFKLRATLANDDAALWPGQSLDVMVKAGEVPDLTVVPGVAVQPTDDGSISYVVKPDNTIDVRKVTVALRVGDMIGLSAGLKPGETVVVEGQSAVRAGTHVTIAEGGAAKATTP